MKGLSRSSSVKAGPPVVLIASLIADNIAVSDFPQKEGVLGFGFWVLDKNTVSFTQHPTPDTQNPIFPGVYLLKFPATKLDSAVFRWLRVAE
jgi:hypothetical protein